MAKVKVSRAHDWRKIAEMAGSTSRALVFEARTSELEVEDVTQPALETALADYKADQVNIDAATAAALTAKDRAAADNRFNQDRLLEAITRVVVDEVNEVRRAASLTAKTFDEVRLAIRDKINTI